MELDRKDPAARALIARFTTVTIRNGGTLRDIGGRLYINGIERKYAVFRDPAHYPPEWLVIYDKTGAVDILFT